MNIRAILAPALLAALVPAGAAKAQSAPPGAVLHELVQADGKYPAGALLRDAGNALYGTAETGGTYGEGTVFKLSPPASGQTAWRSATLHSFTRSPQTTGDGQSPMSGLIMDRAGNLYGTTAYGGFANSGTVFELMPPAAGQSVWTESVLDDFATSGCATPTSALIMDAGGTLYGTTARGGAGTQGCVFKLAPPSQGQTAWTETTLHAFTGGSDGSDAVSGLVADASGKLYGVTQQGGMLGYGTAYELSPPPAGQSQWAETILYDFTGYAPGDGHPASTMLLDSAGALYGTAEIGGGGDGSVFRLNPPASGQTGWTETILFGFNGADGQASSTSLYRTATGILFGTSALGGADQKGLIYKLTPPASGQTAWTQTILYSFTGGADGGNPSSSLIADAAGNLYGEAGSGGAGCSCGTIYEGYH